jgi:hypothetical protein
MVRSRSDCEGCGRRPHHRDPTPPLVETCVEETRLETLGRLTFSSRYVRFLSVSVRFHLLTLTSASGPIADLFDLTQIAARTSRGAAEVKRACTSSRYQINSIAFCGVMRRLIRGRVGYMRAASAAHREECAPRPGHDRITASQRSCRDACWLPCARMLFRSRRTCRPCRSAVAACAIRRRPRCLCGLRRRFP